MHEKPTFLTAEGRATLEAELEQLRTVKRPDVQERLRVAKEFSDTTDNAEFEEAKNEQAFVEGRILTLEHMLATAVMISDDHSKHRDAVTLGSTVTVADEAGESSVYTIVGSAEASPAKGRISNESPVGRAVMGHRPGDRVEAVTPGGILKLRIVSID